MCWRAKRYREYFRISISTQLLYADSHSKSFVSRSRLFASLPLPLPASAEKVPSSGIRNFTDITVKQMGSVHPLHSVSTFLCALSLFLSHSFSLTQSFTDSVCGFCFVVSLSLSLSPLSISLFLSLFLRPPLLPSCILHSSLPVLLYLTCLTISQESFDPHEREPPLFSSTTNLQTGTSRIPEDER